MGRPRLSPENKSQIVSISLDNYTQKILEDLLVLTKKSRSQVVSDAIEYYYSLVTSRGTNG